MADRGLVSRILFPAPRSSYTVDSFPELIFVPKSKKERVTSPEGGVVPPFTEDFVPCLLLTCPSARFLLMVFHTNAEDLGWCYGFCTYLRDQFQVHVMAVEYPGYGIAPGVPCGRTVMENALAAFEFATDVLHWPEKNIKVFGRSIGTGPAMALASLFSLAGVILVTPFVSVQELFRDRIGPLSALVEEWFANDEAAAKITSPTMIIHGQRDNLISCRHGETLYKTLKARKLMVSPPEMEHNTNLLTKLDFFVLPMFQFFTLPDYIFQDIVVPDWAYDKRRVCKKMAPPKQVKEDCGKENVVDSCIGLDQPYCDADDAVLDGQVWGEKPTTFRGERICTPDGMRAFEDRESHNAPGTEDERNYIVRSVLCGDCADQGASQGLQACEGRVYDNEVRFACTLLGTQHSDVGGSVKNPRATPPGARTVHGIFEAAKRERQLNGSLAGQAPISQVPPDTLPKELPEHISKLELRLASEAVTADGLVAAPCTAEPSWSHRSIESVDVQDMDLTEDELVCREARWGHRNRPPKGQPHPAIATLNEGEEFQCNSSCAGGAEAGCLRGPAGFHTMVIHEDGEAPAQVSTINLASMRAAMQPDPTGPQILGMPFLSTCCQQLPSEPLLDLAPPPPARPPMLASTIDDQNRAYSRSAARETSPETSRSGNVLV